MISKNLSIKMNKQEIRLKYKNNRNDEITKSINDLIISLNIKNICVYFPFKYELKINDLLIFLKNNNIDIYYPYMEKINDKVVMKIRKCEGNIVHDDFNIKSYLGIDVDYHIIDAFLIPGIAFNKDGFRVGHGAGFYDYMLKDYNGIKIGACFSDNIVEDDFQEAHDIKMNYLVSEKEVIKIGD